LENATSECNSFSLGMCQRERRRSVNARKDVGTWLVETINISCTAVAALRCRFCNTYAGSRVNHVEPMFARSKGPHQRARANWVAANRKAILEICKNDSLTFLVVSPGLRIVWSSSIAPRSFLIFEDSIRVQHIVRKRWCGRRGLDFCSSHDA
jgi:hypothetical protein